MSRTNWKRVAELVRMHRNGAKAARPEHDGQVSEPKKGGPAPSHARQRADLRECECGARKRPGQARCTDCMGAGGKHRASPVRLGDSPYEVCESH